MARTSDSASVEGLGQLLGGGAAAPVNSQFVCPFCGSVNELAEGPCPRCTMENTPAGRKATKARIGPWYVLQRRNPAAPGMRFETLMLFVRKGRVKPRSVVRGPTTHQLWRFASQVKGLSREFGLCYSCGGSISAQAPVCPQCNRLQDPPADPDAFLETPTDAAAPKSVPTPVAPAPVYVEVPPPREQNRNGVDKPVELPPQPQAETDTADSTQADENHAKANQTEYDETVSDAPEFEADLVIPAIAPDASPQDEEDEEQEIVIPVLANSAQPPVTEIVALRGNPGPSPRRTDEGDRRLSRVAPAVPVELPPRRAVGGGRNRLPPPPREPDPDDNGEEEPFPIMRGTPPPPALGGRRAGVEVVLFVLIIIGAIVSGLFYVDPQLRQQTTGWIHHLKWFRGSDSTDETATADTPRHNNLPPMAATRGKTFDDTSPTPDASTAHSHDLAGLPPSVPTFPVPQPSSAPAPEATAPADQSAAAATAQAATDALYDRARTLRLAGIDADSKGHYREAIDLFEQIKTLPRETWPADVELRLKMARKNAASQKQ